MKKTIPTSIANTLFYIEEDTYQELEQYLLSIREHFTNTQDNVEIIHDIEDRIREQCIEFTGGESSRDRIITKEHVAKLIERMGTPEDFGDTETAQKEAVGKTDPTVDHKKFYRDTDNGIIAGVAAGIGAYFNVDPVVVRILFAASLFLGGFGFLVYIIMWIAAPEAKTAAHKLNMHGNPVNLQSMKDKVNEIKENNRTRSFIATTGRGFATVIGGIIGVAFKIVAGIAYIGIITVCIIALVHPGNTFFVTQIHDAVSLPMYYFVVSILFVASIIPFILLSSLGSMLLRKKTIVRGTVMGLLLSIWLIVLIVGSVLSVSLGTKVRDYISTNPSYSETVNLVPLSAFTTLIAENGQHITVVPGDTYTAKITGRAADIDRILFDQTGTQLTVHNNDQEFRLCLFCRHVTSRIEITVPESMPLSVLETHNASVIHYTGTLNDVSLKLENASSVSLAGTAKSLTANLQNASFLDASKLIATTATITMSNAAQATFYAEKTLIFDAKNASKGIQYGPASIEGATTENASKIERYAGHN